jgi:hypothetical protein
MQSCGDILKALASPLHAPAESQALLQRDKILQQFSLSRDYILLRAELRALGIEQIDQA